MATYVGNTYTLDKCPAEKDGNDCVISGDFEVIEYHSVEPSAYVWSPGYSVVRAGVGNEPHEWEPHCYWVDEYNLLEQIDPERVAKEKREEEEMERAAEREVRHEEEAQEAHYQKLTKGESIVPPSY